MEQVTTTIFYNGQFWIALIEKIQDSGEVLIGNYTFGGEPTTPTLLDFYLNIFSAIPCHAGELKIRLKPIKNIQEQTRITNKAKEIYKGLQKEYLDEHKKEQREENRLEADERYKKKIEMKKKKRKGH